MLFPDVKRRHIRFFPCIRTCRRMHMHHCLNTLATPIVIFRFGRRRALCPETRANFRHLSFASARHPAPRHFFGLPVLLAAVSVPRTSGAGGVAVRLLCSTWHPPPCPPPRRHRLHGNRRLLCRQLALLRRGGWSWQRQSKSEEALKGPGKSFQCNCPDRNEKNVINLSRPGPQSNAPEATALPATCRCGSRAPKRCLHPWAAVLSWGLRGFGGGQHGGRAGESLSAGWPLTCGKLPWLL